MSEDEREGESEKGEKCREEWRALYKVKLYKTANL